MSQKDQAQLQQEESDAALARQLQEEINGGSRQSRQQVPPSEQSDEEFARQLQEKYNRRASGNDSRPVNPTTPPQKISVACPKCNHNNQVRAIQGKKYGCIRCQTELPTMAEYSSDTLGPSIESDTSLSKCKFCHCTNRIPNEKADAMLCGGCHQALELGDLDQNAGVLDTRTVEARCGSCNAVNIVEITGSSTTIQFECGNCPTVNEVTL